jgi:hypothetical protein
MSDDREKNWKDKLSNLLFENDEAAEPTIPADGTSADFQAEPVPSAGAAPVTLPAGDAGLDIPSIYREAGISDQEFATPEQVLELRKTFADLPGDVQKQKVLKTLTSFKVDVATVASNTQQKIAAIERYVNGVRQEGVSTIDTSNQTIEELQKQIDTCKKRIIETQTLLDRLSREGQAAIADLQGVLAFLGVQSAAAQSTPAPKKK